MKVILSSEAEEIYFYLNNRANTSKIEQSILRGIKRKVSFAARFAGMKGPMKDSKGRPTRKALALRAWGFRSVESARNFANRNKQKA